MSCKHCIYFTKKKEYDRRWNHTGVCNRYPNPVGVDSHYWCGEQVDREKKSEGKLMTSIHNQTSCDNPDNNISPIENPSSLFSNSSEATAELSYRIRRHLEKVDERDCSLDAWNCICDALLELHDDKNIRN